MRTTSTFTQNLLGMQSELRRFALKLTADPEEANDLLQETSLKALDNEEKYTPDLGVRDGRAASRGPHARRPSPGRPGRS